MESDIIRHVVRVKQNLNLDNSRELKQELTEVLERGVKQVELDFANTESIDSSGLGKILLFSEKFSQNGGSFKITNVVNPGIKELFTLITLERFVNIDY